MYHFRGKREQLGVILAQSPKPIQSFQKRYADLLRRLAISHLRSSRSLVGQGFRHEYGKAYPGVDGNYQNYLKEQEKPGVWGRDLELQALAEEFGVNVIVTTITTQDSGARELNTFVLHKISGDAPTIHLNNIDNVHWDFDGNTLGDGNCLYHAFAQGLHALAVREFPELKPTSFIPQVNPLFVPLSDKQNDAVKAQDARFSELLNTVPTASQVAEQMEAEKDRIAKLPAEEQRQIADDYCLALQLAMDGSATTKGVYNLLQPCGFEGACSEDLMSASLPCPA